MAEEDAIELLIAKGESLGLEIHAHETGVERAVGAEVEHVYAEEMDVRTDGLQAVLGLECAAAGVENTGSGRQLTDKVEAAVMALESEGNGGSGNGGGHGGRRRSRD